MTHTISHTADNFEQIYLVGVQIDPNSREPDLYTLVLYNEVARNDANRPLTYEDRIVFFRNLKDAGRALALGDIAFRKYGSAPTKVEYVYSVARALAVVDRGAIDEDSMIADFLNELLDFVAISRWTIPENYSSALSSLADYATFHKNIDAFFTHLHKRTETRDAILWCLGAVAMNAVVLR
jgi:hypothetical protein